MPAYRSDAEAEIRNEVVTRLRQEFPSCRIIHEINASSFGNRIDVLAVTEDKIAAVEIKSAKDTLKRLPDQLSAMRGVAHYVVSAIHEKFLEPVRTVDDRWSPEIADRTLYSAPQAASGSTVWAYPMRTRIGLIAESNWPMAGPWIKPTLNLPVYAIDMLWAAELKSACSRNKLKASGTMDVMKDRLRWNLTGETITREICAHLRARICVEADDPIPLA